MFTNGGYNLSDIAAVTRGNESNNSGWGGDGAWWIIILFLFVFCGWGNGNGFGGFGGGSQQGALTRGELCQDMNFADVQSGIRGIADSVNVGFANLNGTICNQQYDTARMINSTDNLITSGFNGVDNAICTLGYQTQAGINSINVGAMQNANALQSLINNCCCDQRAQICDLKYDLATDNCALQTTIANATRDMIDNQNANTRSILDFLVNDKISTLENENQTLKLSASQQAQNNYLVNALRPAPVPAFAVPAPYQFSGCGCGSNGFGGINY